MGNVCCKKNTDKSHTYEEVEPSNEREKNDIEIKKDVDQDSPPPLLPRVRNKGRDNEAFQGDDLDGTSQDNDDKKKKTLPTKSEGAQLKKKHQKEVKNEATDVNTASDDGLEYEEVKQKGSSAKDESEIVSEDEIEYEELKIKDDKEEQLIYEECKVKSVLVALYNYTNPVQHEGDNMLEFKMGDKMELIREEGNKYFVKHKMTNASGFVQKIYVCLLNEAKSRTKMWYFGDIKAQEAISLLKNCEDKTPGTFLVRDSSVGGFTIYVLTADDKSQVKKHLIEVTPHDQEKQGFHIKDEDKVYPTLDALIQACQESQVLSSMQLGEPCKRPSLKKESAKPNIEFIVKKKIGKGHFSEVYQGRWEDRDIVVKKLKKLQASKSDWEREVKLMMTVQHKNLLKCYEHYVEGETFCIVLEWMAKGDLLKYLREDSERKIASHHMTRIASEIVAGMTYLEERKLIHRDLAARNILVGSNDEIKISDFGLARALTDNIVYDDPDCPFPIHWTAPEALTGTFSSKSDVWSFGIVLFEIFTRGEKPYKGMVKNEIIMSVGRGLHPKRPRNSPDFIYGIMESCWRKEPDGRPSFKELAENFAQELQSESSQEESENPTIQFVDKKSIGDGNFSDVYQAMWKGKNVAVKKLKKLKVSKANWEREVEIMMNVQHKNLVKCYGQYIDGDDYCILLEWMEKGDLLKYLKEDNKGKNASHNTMTKIAAEIAAGMTHLEKQNLIHRDLAARNVLVGSKDEMKIADFGLARALTDNIVYDDPDCPFPVHWTAPEAFTGKFSSKSDVWSFGITLFEIFTRGENPYKGMVKNSIIINVGRGLRPKRPRNTPDFIYEIMAMCWQKEPEKRPSFKTLSEKFEHELQNGTKSSNSESDEHSPSVSDEHRTSVPEKMKSVHETDRESRNMKRDLVSELKHRFESS